MGTSQSSKGPASNISLVPPWVDDVPELPPADVLPDDTASPEQHGAPAADQVDTNQVAPPARFAAARTNIGSFTRNGLSTTMRRGVGQYVRNGYGGSATITRRMAGTARTAGALDGILRTGTLPDGSRIADQILSSGGDVNAVLDAIVNSARPSDGSQDAESTRHSVRDALSDLLARFPDANLAELTDAERSFVIERYAALDVFGRFCLDMQGTIMDKAADPATGLIRLRQIRDYIASTVRDAFQKLRDQGRATTGNVAALTRGALAETFRVFEEYL